jgi:hypothetical protein
MLIAHHLRGGIKPVSRCMGIMGACCCCCWHAGTPPAPLLTSQNLAPIWLPHWPPWMCTCHARSSCESSGVLSASMRALQATHDLTHGVFSVPGRKVKGLLLAAQVAASQDGQVGRVMPACDRSRRWGAGFVRARFECWTELPVRHFKRAQAAQNAWGLVCDSAAQYEGRRGYADTICIQPCAYCTRWERQTAGPCCASQSALGAVTCGALYLRL